MTDFVTAANPKEPEPMDTAQPLNRAVELITLLADNYRNPVYCQNARTELLDLLKDPKAAEYMVGVLIIGLRQSRKYLENRGLHEQYEEQLRLEELDVDKRWQKFDEFCFLPVNRKYALLSLGKELAELPLAEAASRSVAKAALEELPALLLDKDTPDWLCKAVAGDVRFRGLVGTAVELPAEPDSSPPDKNDEWRRNKQIDESCKQVEKLLKWLEECPVDTAPPPVDPLSYEMQSMAGARVRSGYLQKYSLDQLVTLLNTNILPAWARRVIRQTFKRSSICPPLKERRKYGRWKR